MIFSRNFSCRFVPPANLWFVLVLMIGAQPLFAEIDADVGAVADIHFSACDHSYKTPGDAECGHLTVPENPDNPQGRHISLNIMRIPALTSTAADPLFVIVGGPGGAAVQSARQYLPWFRGLQKHRDIIFVDQRGTGESNGLQCRLGEGQLFDLSDEDRLDKAEDMAAACVAELDANLAFYTTPYAVGDLDQVRRALGYEKINLWGVSYGTRVILDYMRRHPEAVRTAVLDSLAPVSIQLPRFVARDGSRALALVFEQCESDPTCFGTYGDLRSGWVNLLDRLDAAPRTITLSHPRSQQPVSTYISANTLSSWMRLTLYSRELAPLIPEAIQRAIHDDFSLFGGIALLAAEDITEHLSQGMQTTILCAEDRQYARMAGAGTGAPDVEETERLLRLDITESLERICEYFPAGKLPETYFEPVHSEVPTLLLSGNYDPVTPPIWGQHVASTLPNSRHIVVAGAHHGVTMQGCVSRLVQNFIEAGSAADLKTECVDTIQPRAFFIDSAGPALQHPPAVGEAS